MSATLDHTLPPWAVSAWVDKNYVYIAIPCQSAPPYITKYPLTDGGLGRALELMKSHHLKHAPITGNHSFNTDHIKVKRTPRSFSESQKQGARALLRKLGIIT